MIQQHLIALSKALPGREGEFEQWYGERHLADVTRIDAFQTGALFRRIGGDGRWDYMAVYAFTGESGAALSELFARAGSPSMPISDAMDRSAGAMIVAEARQGEAGTAAFDASDRILTAFCDPAPGAEAAFHRWMDDQHIPDMLRTPGVLGALRFRLRSARPDAPAPYAFVTAYSLAGGREGDAILSEIEGRVRTSEMPLSDAADLGRSSVSVFACMRRTGA